MSQNTAVKTDRRQRERKVVHKPVTLIVDSDRQRIANSAFAIDLSELGARIRSSLDLVPGQLVTIIPKEGDSQALPSRVVWVGRTGSERADEAGIAFMQPVTVNQ